MKCKKGTFFQSGMAVASSNSEKKGFSWRIVEEERKAVKTSPSSSSASFSSVLLYNVLKREITKRGV